MIQRIKELLDAVLFVPFKIKTSAGSEYLIPTPDHAAVPPKLGRVLVFEDLNRQVTLSGLHVVAVEESVASV